MTGNLDYLVARLHGRRSSLFEGERLDALSRIGNLQEFMRAVFPEREFRGTTDFQRQLIEELAGEFSSLPGHLDRAEAHLIDWMPARLEAENIKVLLRASITKTPIEEVRERLVPLPGQTAAVVESLVKAGSLTDFATLLPYGPLRKGLENAIRDYSEDARPFFLEAALDSGYLSELLARFALLSARDRDETEAVICQEADIFHLALVLRGRFNYGLTADQLLPFHVPGTRISRTTFTAMLNDHDPWIAVGRAIMRAIDPLPLEGGPGESSSTIQISLIENLAWRRYYRLANTAFRRSHMGFGVVVGYVAIRRLEVANLITISEGVRRCIGEDVIRARMIPRVDMEASHV